MVIRQKTFQEKINIKLSNGVYWSCLTSELIHSILQVVNSYHEQGIRMTLRQLYYQLVAGDLVPNDVKVYTKLSKVVTDLRYAGAVDWDVIVDHGRIPKIPLQFESVADLTEVAIDNFRLPRHSDQEYAIELLTEKDALRSVLEPITHNYHIPLVVNRGYASATAIHALFERINEYLEDGKHPILLYLGDHDPSGLDMIRDIEERLAEFIEADSHHGGPAHICDPDEIFSVIHIGLTKEQIEEISPPPNPAKITDPRAKWYIKRHGRKSWEVDAIPPEKLIRIVESAITGHLDIEKYEAWKEREKQEIKSLREAVSTL